MKRSFSTLAVSSLLLVLVLLGLQALPATAQNSTTNFDNVTLTGDLLVGDDVSLGGNLSVAGAIVASDFVTESGDVDFPANLAVISTTTTGALDSTGNAVIGGNLRVVGTSALNGNVTVTGTSNLLGNLSDSSGALTVADNVMVDGGADAVQLLVQGHSTQTNNIFVVENSSGTDQFVVTNGGDATVTDDLAANDLTVADFANYTAQDSLSVTMNGWLTPTGSLQPITSAGAVSINGGTRIAHVTDYLMLVNVGAQTITISETTGLVSAGNIALGAGDTAILVWANSSWYQMSGSNN